MNKVLLLFVFVPFIANSIFGQTLPSLQADRPDQTESAFLVPAKHWQFETGFTYEKVDDNTNAFQYPTILSKYGVNDFFELRLITEMVGIKQGNNTISGISPLTVGFKAKLSDEKGAFPAASFIGHISIPDAAGKNFKATYYAPSFRFNLQHTLSEKVSLAYNLGAEWDGETPEPTFLYTLAGGYTFTEKLGGYIELYGFAPQKSISDHRFDGGLTYLIKKNIMVDISGGMGISKHAPDYYVALGFSFRLKD